LDASIFISGESSYDPTIPVMPAEVVKLLARCFLPRPEEHPATMLEVATALQEIYERELGHLYPRQASKAADALADSLNNRALSLFDLGKIEEAKQVWQQALQADPHHAEATYNQGITLWRQGRLTDDVLVRQIGRDAGHPRRTVAAQLSAGPGADGARRWGHGAVAAEGNSPASS